MEKNSVVFYISWTKMSDSDYELPCFKLTFDFYDVGKTGNNNSESMNEFQTSTKSNNNNTAVRRRRCICMTRHIKLCGKPLNLSTVYYKANSKQYIETHFPRN